MKPTFERSRIFPPSPEPVSGGRTRPVLAHLVLVGRRTARVFCLHEGRTSIGTESSAILLDPDDAPTVSPRHATFSVSLEDGLSQVVIEDAGSLNGTYVDGRRVEAALPLHGGETIRLGSVECRFDMGDPVDLSDVPPAPIAARLVGYLPSGRRAFPVHQGPNIIGHGPDADIVIPRDDARGIGARHARIDVVEEWGGFSFLVSDLCSGGLTAIDHYNVAPDQSIEIVLRDRLRLGEVEFFLCEPPAPGDEE